MTPKKICDVFEAFILEEVKECYCFVSALEHFWFGSQMKDFKVWLVGCYIFIL